MTPTAEIEACRASHARLDALIAGLDDDAVCRPSLLPGWSIGHLLTHLARNADSGTRRIEAAGRGENVAQYPGGREQRAADIEAGAGRSAAELVADVKEASARLDAAFATLPDDRWDQLTGGGVATDRPAFDLPFGRWREVEVHMVDLGLGYSPTDWPVEIVDRWLPIVLRKLADRTDPRALLAWTLRRGPAPDLEPW